MTTRYSISIQEFCKNYHVDELFVTHFKEAQIVQIISENQQDYITEENLPKLEKMVRLHQDLGINLEGLEAIAHLLERIEEMNTEMQSLKNKLRLYE
ncbi:MerR family transcriptional regulator [Galbibacter sp. BG1]|uniref:chaperone modulator CbpM n=1 Tax=Galbibacter sp. BG1 TaxID=1170699 RepID=UPI0015BDD12E|nr:chaperone modulator CbpM [Galbibacter sp. BG1]QLE00690.1 MerR family transcriptional regulator [Galbibacter sp. BG1]